MARRNQDFQTIRSEGGLLPHDLLRRVLDPKEKLEGTRPEDYGLPQGERLNEVITQSWSRLRKHWAEFHAAKEKLPDGEAGTGLTNDKWNLPLLRELGFGHLPTSAGPEVGGRTYAISRFFGPVPAHLIGCGLSLDRRAAGQRGAAAANPHGLVQEFLNRSSGHLWAIVSNGLRLRVLRDNQALSRQSFLEFDLEAMFDGEVHSDFVLLWLMVHATRFAPREGDQPKSCLLEHWTREAQEKGTRALGELRGGVERAIQILGEGFTSHSKNPALRAALRSSQLPLADFHGQLLRVVYRLIFLFVAEDRTLEGQTLLHPYDGSDEALTGRDHYTKHYSTARLREMANKIKGSRHSDLWKQLQVLVGALSGEEKFAAVRKTLSLPSLGSFLWSPSSTAALNDAELANYDFLEALRHLAFTRQGKMLRPVDYKNLGAEELGGVYESLLALTPQISADGARFSFAEFAGNERKTSGSYYTPDSLVHCLLDSALDPVVEEAIKGKAGEEAEKAILALKVCDPAVGSGHFLVGAAHRLARHLSRVRALAQGESEPSPLLYQHALRDVIGRCLYGVDVNPMAAELCRVSLWLEAMEPGKPLSFLDHHIRVGNSLLGTTPDFIAAGLPDEAFKPIEGDDKMACAVLKKRNKSERKGLGPLFAAQDAETQTRLQQAAAALEEIPDDRPEDIRAKELAFRHHEETEGYLQKRRLADTWCAAFVIKKYFRELGREASASGITQDHLTALAEGRALPIDLVAEVGRLADEYQFFHWHLNFPEVFGKGGFDCVLGNPPWGQVQFEPEEFFALRAPEIANAAHMAERDRMIAAIQRNDQRLFEDYVAERRAIAAVQHLIHDINFYPLTSKGRLNTAPLFCELGRHLLITTGRCGLIVPTGIATDSFTQGFIRDLLQTRSLFSLLSFENEEFVFPAVHHATRFCLLTVGKGNKPVSEIAEFVFFARQVEHLRDPKRRFTLSVGDIARLSPNTGTCPVFRSRLDAQLTNCIYSRTPVLVREGPGADREVNPWSVTFQLMFMMNTASHLFRTAAELQADGWTLTGNVYIRGDQVYLPLYEAKMIHHFDHRWGTYEGQTAAQSNQGKLPEFDADQHRDPTALVVPRYWIPESTVLDRLAGKWARRWLMGVRDICRSTDRRTVIASLLPSSASSGVNLFLTGVADGKLVALLLANLSSYVLDYGARQRVGGTHLSQDYLTQLPVLPPDSYAVSCTLVGGETMLLDWLSSRVLELVYTAWDVRAFAQDWGWSGPPFRWDEERRFLLRCELDAAFFHLYLPAEKSGDWRPAESETAEELARLKQSFPTPRDAVAYIMDTFPILRRKDEEKYDGDYRTKRVILEIYDALQEAIRTGQSYQTRLDPPPGPPVDENGNFVDYATIADNPPPHIHLSRDGTGHAELQLSDLGAIFPPVPFIVRLGTSSNSARVRVTPVPSIDVQAGARVVFGSSALQLHGTSVPAVMGPIGIEARTDATSGESYVLISVRTDGGIAQARLPEEAWKTLTTIGVVEDLP